MHMFLYVITFFLFSIPCVHAMDLEVQKKENLFDELPLELHTKIIKTIFSLIIREDDDSDEHREAINKCFNRIIPREHIDQKKLDQYVLYIPIPLGVALTYKFHQLQEMCQNEIGGKKLGARELFVLPREQQDVFIRMASRGFLKRVSEGDLSTDDYKVLEVMKDEGIKKGLKLKLLHGNKTVSYMRPIGILGMYSAFVSLFGAIGFNTKNTYLPYLIAGLGLSGASLYGVSFMLEICVYGACIIKKRF